MTDEVQKLLHGEMCKTARLFPSFLTWRIVFFSRFSMKEVFDLDRLDQHTSLALSHSLFRPVPICCLCVLLDQGFKVASKYCKPPFASQFWMSTHNLISTTSLTLPLLPPPTCNIRVKGCLPDIATWTRKFSFFHRVPLSKFPCVSAV